MRVKPSFADFLTCKKCAGSGFVSRKHEIGKLVCVSCGGDGLIWREVWGTAERREHMSKIGTKYAPLHAARAFEGTKGFVTTEEAARRRALHHLTPHISKPCATETCGERGSA